MTQQVPEWVLNPTAENLVKWLDTIHKVSIDPQYLDDATVQKIAHARTRDRTLDTLVALGERNIVDGSVMKVMTDAAQDGSHHLTEGEHSSVMDWFLSKVEANEWSEGMRYELQGVINVVLPAFRGAGLTEPQIMKLTENPTKARAAVTHMRDLLSDLEKDDDDWTKAHIENMYHDLVDPTLSAARLKAKLSGYVEPEPIIIERVWTDDNASITVLYTTDRVQNQALDLVLRKLPHELHTTDLLTLASNLLGPITEE